MTIDEEVLYYCGVKRRSNKPKYKQLYKDMLEKYLTETRNLKQRIRWVEQRGIELAGEVLVLRNKK